MLVVELRVGDNYRRIPFLRPTKYFSIDFELSSILLYRLDKISGTSGHSKTSLYI
jgi:hypothetical protein